MTTTNENQAGARPDLPSFPTRTIRCAIVIKEVDLEQERVTGFFKMSTLEGCEMYFTYSKKYSLPRLSKNMESKDNGAFRLSVKKRIKSALAIIGRKYEGIGNAPTEEWLMAKVVEECFYD